MPFLRRSYGSISLALIAAGFVFLALIVVASLWIADRARDQNLAIGASQELVTAAHQLMTLLERAETGRRGLLITGDPSFADVAKAALRDVERPISILRQADPGDLGHPFSAVETLVDRKLENIVQSLSLVAEGRLTDAVAAFSSDQGRQDLIRLRETLDSIISRRSEALAEDTAAANRNIQRFVIVTVLSVLLLLGLAAGSVFLLSRYTREIGASRSELSALNSSLEDVVAERTADLLAANAEIQRFAYIVSHDLRSPLVNIMGFTSELEAGHGTVQTAFEKVAKTVPDAISPEVREVIETDWPEAIRFIRSATQKMDRLINAILKLSRQGRRVFAPQRLNMTELLTGIADVVRHQATEIGATITVNPLPEIIADRLAAEQVFSNLIDNAVKYLSGDRPGLVEVSGRVIGRSVEFVVRDNGRGIAEQDMDRIFDLFRRSGVQDRPGEGIGLAHVRSLVRRMGGTITCSSALGSGTEFRVVLPSVMKAEERGSE